MQIQKCESGRHFGERCANDATTRVQYLSAYVREMLAIMHTLPPSCTIKVCEDCRVELLSMGREIAREVGE